MNHGHTKNQNEKVSQGEIILFSNGEYSDYGYCGEVIFTKDCNLAEQIEIYKTEIKTEDEDQYYSHSGFVTWLIAKQFALPLESREIHIGSYSQLEI